MAEWQMIERLKLNFDFFSSRKLSATILTACFVMVILAIFEDYLHSIRYDTSFVFFESLLFKTFWLYFPPILLFLKSALIKTESISILQMSLAVVVSTLAHLALVPITIWSLSAIFRDQSYGIIKVLTYTLSNDLVKLILIYGAFVLLLKYLGNNNKKEVLKTQTSSPQYLTIVTGKENTRVNFSDILFIKAATPYIEIQLEAKQYLDSNSLKSILNKLDARFVRVHKSSIVNVDKVISFKSRLNGDYDLMLFNQTEIRLSRNYVSEFKSRFDSTPQLSS